ncbi:hypothetical protein GCM10025859_04910 [Alicyclobacillus fastidiosus]|nr:hypothetical protein GCM10025859_04910 [Alicyclobacillus fastidiosus]
MRVRKGVKVRCKQGKEGEAKAHGAYVVVREYGFASRDAAMRRRVFSPFRTSSICPTPI